MGKIKKYTFLRHLIVKTASADGRHFENRLGDYRVITATIIPSTATNQRGEFSIITYVTILSLLKVRLHTAIRRSRLVFWHIQSSRHASICGANKISPQFRYLELWHQMNFIHQNPNRTGPIAMCKRPCTLKNKVCIFNTPSVAKFTHLKACFLDSLRCVFCGKGVYFYTPLGVYLQDKGV